MAEASHARSHRKAGVPAVDSAGKECSGSLTSRGRESARQMSKDEMAGSEVIGDAVEPGAFQRHMEAMQRGAAEPQSPPDGAKPYR